MIWWRSTAPANWTGCWPAENRGVSRIQMPNPANSVACAAQQVHTNRLTPPVGTRLG